MRSTLRRSTALPFLWKTLVPQFLLQCDPRLAWVDYKGTHNSGEAVTSYCYQKNQIPQKDESYPYLWHLTAFRNEFGTANDHGIPTTISQGLTKVILGFSQERREFKLNLFLVRNLWLFVFYGCFWSSTGLYNLASPGKLDCRIRTMSQARKGTTAVRETKNCLYSNQTEPRSQKKTSLEYLGGHCPQWEETCITVRGLNWTISLFVLMLAFMLS